MSTNRRMISLHLAPETQEALARTGVPRHLSVGRHVDTALARLDRLSQLAPLDQKLGRGFYEFALEQLTNPWSLSASDIQALPSILSGDPQIAAAARSRGYDFSDFVAAIERLRYADRLALVDRAQKFHAQTD